MSCNPCNPCPVNSASNETLESKLSNFSQEFFGKVLATSINNQRTILLPCDLNSALPANPRGDTESLACYFQRLFKDGVDGTLGPKGDPGVPGIPGRPNYAVMTSGFSVPATLNSSVQFSVVPTLAISVGQIVFIKNAGWFLITAFSGYFQVTALLCGLVPIPASYIPSGTEVQAAGPKGDSVQGATGVVGPQGLTGLIGPVGTVGGTGSQGVTGPAATLTTGTFTFENPSSIPVYAVPQNFSQIAFYDANNVSRLKAALPSAGVYLIRAMLNVQNTSGVTQIVSFGLSSSQGGDIPGTLVEKTWGNGQYDSVCLDTIYIAPSPCTVIVLGSRSLSNNPVNVIGPRSLIFSVKLA